jgi:hypothetical protein
MWLKLPMMEDDAFVCRAVPVFIILGMEGDCFFDVGVNTFPDLLPRFSLGFEDSLISFFPAFPEDEAR